MNLFRRRRIDAYVDMTPMIDTLLQLFMIFMFGATFISSSLDMQLPQATGQQKTTQTLTDEIVVTIDAKRKIYLNNTPIGNNQLKDELKALLSGAQGPSVTLLADRNLPYEQIIEVLVDIHSIGATTVRLGYDPKTATARKDDGN